MPHARLLPIAISTLIGLYVSAAWGATVTINPVRIHLSASRRSEIIEIRNSGLEPARFQLKANAWHENADGEMTLAPTRDLLFFPSLLEVKPGETRRIRVASTVAPGISERTYRLIADEFPRAPTPGTVQVLTRLSIPVFVQPPDPKPRPAVEAKLEQGQLVIGLSNRGNAAFKTESVRVVARSASGEVVFEQSMTGWYVLAGGRRRYALELPPGACAAIGRIDAAARTEVGTVDAAREVTPSAGCGE